MSLGEAVARLTGLGPARLQDLYFALKIPTGHRVGFRGPERRTWGKADAAVRADLAALIAATDPQAKPLPKLGDARDGAIAALKEEAGSADALEVLATWLAAVRGRIERGGDEVLARLRIESKILGVGADGLDWAHAERALAAWHRSLATTDADTDATHLPNEARELVEIYDAFTSGRAKAKEQKKSGKARKSLTPVAPAGPAKTYSPKEHFAEGTRIAHPKFGEGTVVAVAGTSMRVKFRDGERTLAQAPAPAILVAPMEKPKPPPPPPIAPKVQITRLAPDPRLSEDHAAAAFSDLKEKDEEEDTAD